jgi:hypothetical protein
MICTNPPDASWPCIAAEMYPLRYGNDAPRCQSISERGGFRTGGASSGEILAPAFLTLPTNAGGLVLKFFDTSGVFKIG